MLEDLNACCCCVTLEGGEEVVGHHRWRLSVCLGGLSGPLGLVARQVPPPPPPWKRGRLLLVRRVFPKGLTWWSAVGVQGRWRQGIQRGLMGQRSGRSYRSRWRLLLRGFFPIFALLKDSGDESNFLFFCVFLPVLDLPGIRSKEVIPTHWHD